MAEAMSGFAAINGEPDGPPLLPPIALTDEVTAIAGAFAVMVALHDRERDRSRSGDRRQSAGIDAADDVGVAVGGGASRLRAAAARFGHSVFGAARNVSLRGQPLGGDSTSAETVAHRVLTLLGLDDDERFATFESRAEHREELDAEQVRPGSARPSAEVLAVFEDAEAAIAPVYTMLEVLADPHVRRGGLRRGRRGRDAGPLARLSRTPAEMRWAGRALGADTDAVLGEL